MTLVSVKPRIHNKPRMESGARLFVNTPGVIFGRGDYLPKVDIIESDKGYNFYFELPGMSSDDVKINLVKNVLKIKGDRINKLLDEKELKVVKTENIYGSFERSFKLSEDIDVNSVEAKLENGILKVSILKKEEKIKERIIEVK